MLKANLKNIYKITFVIIGTIIGAGFASGQEIYSFFNKYGSSGLIGIIVSVTLMGFIINKTLKIVIKNDIKGYKDFLIYILPEKIKNNKLLVLTIDSVINIFLLISFNIMVAGFATYFFQELAIPKIYGAIVCAILSFIVIRKDITGVIRINTFLVPAIIILIIFLGFKKINYSKVTLETENLKINFWAISSFIYASYNSIALIPILISLKNKVQTKKESNLITIFVFIILLLLSIIIFLLINSFINEAHRIEIPIVYIAGLMGNFFKYIYGFVILSSIFTTAVGSGYGFLTNITTDKYIHLRCAALICIFSILVAQIKFSNLINVLYPVFGLLGLTQIFFLIKSKTP